MISLYVTRIDHPHSRQTCSDAAHALLRYAMKEQGFDPDALKLCRTPAGKPYFAGGEMEFSISHSGPWAVCALSPHPVGVDMERIRCVSPRLWQKYLAKHENEPYGGDREAILRWTRYEAALKRVGKAAPAPDAEFATYHGIPGYLLTVCGDGDVPPIRWVGCGELHIES